MLISPKNSPAPKVARIFSVSRTVLVMFTFPAWTTYISLPGLSLAKEDGSALELLAEALEQRILSAHVEVLPAESSTGQFSGRDGNHTDCALNRTPCPGMAAIPLPAAAATCAPSGKRHSSPAPGLFAVSDRTAPASGRRARRRRTARPASRTGAAPRRTAPPGMPEARGAYPSSKGSSSVVGGPPAAQLEEPHRLLLALHPHGVQLAHGICRRSFRRCAPRRGSRRDHDVRAVLLVHALEAARGSRCRPSPCSRSAAPSPCCRPPSARS